VKRPLKPEELRVWRVVAATVHPLPGRETPVPAPSWGEEGEAKPRPGGDVSRQPPDSRAGRDSSSLTASRSVAPHKGEGKGIEPGRKHRIARERDPIGARLDLHGLDQDRARAMLEAFLRRAWDAGERAVLVITGKGVRGDGVLRRRAPEWLAAPHLAAIVAGVSEAHRRHGGEGALYVALKRKPRS
jgi:DNA-nicking Smr family endonuclease